MQLEVACTDRHLDSVSIPAGGRQRAGDRRLRDTEEPERPPCGRLRALDQPQERRRLEHARPELLQLARRSRERDGHRTPGLEHDRRRGPDHLDPERAVRQRRLFEHTVGEVRVGPVQPFRDAS